MYVLTARIEQCSSNKADFKYIANGGPTKILHLFELTEILNQYQESVAVAILY